MFRTFLGKFVIVQKLYQLTHLFYIILVLFIVALTKTPRGSTIYILHMGGFGNIVNQADTFFSNVDKNGFIICLYTPMRHNPEVKRLYGTRFLLVNRGAIIKGFRYENKVIECSAISKVKKLLSRSFLTRSLCQLQDLKHIAMKKGIDVNDEGWGFWKSKLWFINLPRDNASVSFLRKQFFEEFKVLDNVLGKNVCSLYLRKKGNPNVLKDYCRNNKDLEMYLPILEQLKELNFSVLVYGDVSSRDLDVCSNLSWVHTFIDFGLSKPVWDVFAPVYSDFTIGASGGGLQIPVSLGKKILLLDAFGYWNWYPNCLHSFKTIANEEGGVVNPTRFLINDTYTDEFDQLTIRNQTSELDIRVLLEFMSLLSRWPLRDSLLNNIQSKSISHFATGAIISREWLLHNEVNF